MENKATEATAEEHPMPNNAPEFEIVDWRKDPALRKLYFFCTFGLLVASATTGYDG